MKKNLKGFTLVEMLIVISIIAILSGSILAGMGSSRSKARNARVVSDVNTLQLIVENAYDDGAYPQDPAAIAGTDGVKAANILNNTNITYCTSDDDKSYRIAGVLEAGKDAEDIMESSITGGCNNDCGTGTTFCVGE